MEQGSGMVLIVPINMRPSASFTYLLPNFSAASLQLLSSGTMTKSDCMVMAASLYDAPALNAAEVRPLEREEKQK